MSIVTDQVPSLATTEIVPSNSPVPLTEVLFALAALIGSVTEVTATTEARVSFVAVSELVDVLPTLSVAVAR